jgi:hypothetical protein
MRSNHLIIAAVIAVLFTGSSAQAAGSQSGHWSFTQLDRDKNGTVSKVEFSHFGSVEHSIASIRTITANLSATRCASDPL